MIKYSSGILVLSLLLFQAAVDAQENATKSPLARMGAGYEGDGGLAIRARLNRPSGLAVDSEGNLYIADTWNQVVRVLDPTGNIQTVAGTGAKGYGGDGGPATKASLLFPSGIAINSKGDLFIADTQNHRIRRVSKDGRIETVAGTGTRGYSGNGEPAIKAKLSWPQGLVIDRNDVLYFSESLSNTIRKITPDGIIAHVAGTPSKDRYNPGTLLNHPFGVAVDTSGAVYVADRDHHRIVKVSVDGTASTVATLRFPTAVALSPNGSVFATDETRVLEVANPGVAIPFLSNGPDSDEPIPDRFQVEGGDVITVPHVGLKGPGGLAIDAKGIVYVAETYRNRILKVPPGEKPVVVAGLSQ